ncbi:MAG TPA: hypothetical protein VFL55_24205 [Acetobacteraceae bacterium]|nr:hypothetical protein [Acetobacteraceae bacterium]
MLRRQASHLRALAQPVADDELRRAVLEIANRYDAAADRVASGRSLP